LTPPTRLAVRREIAQKAQPLRSLRREKSIPRAPKILIVTGPYCHIEAQ